MIVTEEEAKTKWCPEARVAMETHGYGAGNRFGDDRESYVGKQTLCVGAACMAWRWAAPVAGVTRDPAAKLGYCGKAGKPESVQ